MSQSVNGRDKQDRHEFPSGVRYSDPEHRRFDGSLPDTAPLWGFHHVPDTEMAALMVCLPFEDPKDSILTVEQTGRYIEDMMECLDAKELAVIDMLVFGQMSLAECGRILGKEFGRERPYSKAMVAKYRDRALAKLRETFE